MTSHCLASYLDRCGPPDVSGEIERMSPGQVRTEVDVLVTA